MLIAGAADEASAASVHGAVLIEGAVKVDDGRYKSPKDWDRTLRFFRSAYGKKPGIVWMNVAATPRVKAKHLANTNPGASWEGINIYQVRGEVFIFVIEGETEKEKKPGRGKRSKSS